MHHALFLWTELWVFTFGSHTGLEMWRKTQVDNALHKHMNHGITF
jgi:hypothetical protein